MKKIEKKKNRVRPLSGPLKLSVSLTSHDRGNSGLLHISHGSHVHQSRRPGTKATEEISRGDTTPARKRAGFQNRCRYNSLAKVRRIQPRNTPQRVMRQTQSTRSDTPPNKTHCKGCVAGANSPNSQLTLYAKQPVTTFGTSAPRDDGTASLTRSENLSGIHQSLQDECST